MLTATHNTHDHDNTPEAVLFMALEIRRGRGSGTAVSQALVTGR